MKTMKHEIVRLENIIQKLKIEMELRCEDLFFAEVGYFLNASAVLRGRFADRTRGEFIVEDYCKGVGYESGAIKIRAIGWTAWLDIVDFKNGEAIIDGIEYRTVS